MLRHEADTNRKTIVATTYQAGNTVYDQFDKILVIAEGRVIYYGPRSIARKYFEDLGFICPKGANIADFLTSVTVLTERVIQPGLESSVPSTPDEFEARFRETAIYGQMMGHIDPPEKLTHEIEEMKMAVSSEKRKQHIPRPQSPYTASIWEQIQSCTLRYVAQDTLHESNANSSQAISDNGRRQTVTFHQDNICHYPSSRMRQSVLQPQR